MQGEAIALRLFEASSIYTFTTMFRIEYDFLCYSILVIMIQEGKINPKEME